MHDDTRLVCREIINLTNLNLAFLVGFEDGLDDFGSGGTEGDLGDNKCLIIIRLGDAGADLHHSSSFAVVIARDINDAARREIGEELERLIAQIRQGSIAKLIEIMRKNFRIESDRNTFYALREQKRELNRQVNRFVFSSVIRLHPLGSLGIEDCFEGELREARLYITRRRRPVSGKDIAPVPLTINEEVFLAELDQGIADRRIAMRVILHGLADDIGYLVILAVIHRFHRMQDTPLHGLETILNSRNSALQDHIRRIIQEPILVHAGKMILHSIIKSTLACHASVILFY